MNLEQLKDTWNKERIEETPEISLEKQKQIHTPLEMIRMNMRTEFWLSIILILSILFAFPFIVEIYSDKFYLFSTLIIVTLSITFYYYFKFYTFYKKISTKSLNTYHNLLDLRYELVLNTELYKSYYILFVPIYFCFQLISETFEKEPNFIYTIISSFSYTFILYISAKFYLHSRFGKYIEQISKIISEMYPEEDEFIYNRSIVNLGKNV